MSGLGRGKGLIITAMAVGMASAAHAATVSYNANWGPQSIPTASGPAASLPLFDPSLGVLTQVTITLNADTEAGSIIWDNESDIVTDVTLGVGATVTATAPGALTLTAVPLQSNSTTGVAADNDGAADFAGADSFTVAGGSGSDSDTDSLTGVAVAPYIGVGNFNVNIGSVLATSVITSGGFGPTSVVNGTTDGTVEVTYEYTPIPEPASLGLLAAGGLMMLRRRRA
jgi:hypothetical protein